MVYDNYPQGLLDSGMSPLTQGLLGASAGLMMGSGRQDPWQAVGLGMQGFINGQNQGRMMQLKAADMIPHAELARAQAEKLKALTAMAQGLSGQFANPGQAQGQPQGGGGGMGGGMTMGGQTPAGASMPGGAANGGFPVSLAQIAQMKVLGGPDLLAEYKYANDGVKQDGGSFYKNPITGQVQYIPKIPEGMQYVNGQMVPIPGYTAGVAAAERAKTSAQESAKSQYDLVQVQDANGQMVYVPRSSLVGGGPGAGGNGMMGGNGLAGGGNVSARNPSDVEYDKDKAKYWAEYSKGLQNGSLAAQGNITKLNTIQQLLADHDGGKLSGMGMDIASLANSLGLNVDKNLPNKEAADAISNALSLSARSTAEGGGMPGAMSDKDREFLVKMNPSVMQSKEGRDLLVGIQKSLAQRQIEVARMARAWEGRFGRLDRPDGSGKSFSDYLDTWRNANPLIAQDQGAQ